ncbi:MAG: hypothetical protein ABW197_04480 [Methyloceanibacter sp.]
MAADPSPPLVLIEWLDSGQPVPGWQWMEAIEPRRPHLCVSVGFLMQDDASAKVLAPNLGANDGSGDWDQASGVITIPALAVRRMLAVSPLGDRPVNGLPGVGRAEPRDPQSPLGPCQISTKRLNQGVVC